MKLLSANSFLLLLFALNANAQMPIGWQAQVTKGVQALNNADLLVGGVVGFADGDDQPVSLGFGETDLGSRVQPDQNSIFEIGSVTKEFTALALAEIVIESKGSATEVLLDDTVEKYLKEFKGTFIGGVTLRQLATHTSGLERMPCGNTPDPLISFCFNPENEANPYTDYTWPKLEAYLMQYVPKTYDPTKPRPAAFPYVYSNTGFGFLGYLLAQIDGTSYEQMIRNRITVPLGMTDTTMTLTPAQQIRFVNAHDLMRQIVSHWDFDVLAPAGGLRSTVKDLLTFGIANLDPSKVLVPNLMKAIELTQSENLGWDSAAGAQTIWKDGGTGGFVALLSFTPSKKLVQVIAYNMPLTNDSMFLLGLPFGEKTPDLVGANLADAQLDLLLGEYTSPKGSLRIIRTDHFLDAMDPMGDVVKLLPKSPLEFEIIDGAYPDGWNTLSVIENSQGAVTGLIMHPKNPDGSQGSDIIYNK